MGIDSKRKIVNKLLLEEFEVKKHLFFFFYKRNRRKNIKLHPCKYNVYMCV